MKFEGKYNSVKENRLLLEIFISRFHKQSGKCSGRNSPGKGVKIHIKTTMSVSLFNKVAVITYSNAFL